LFFLLLLNLEFFNYFLRSTGLSILKWNRIWRWIWSWINKVSRVSFGCSVSLNSWISLNFDLSNISSISGVGFDGCASSFHGCLSYINVLFFLLFLPLSSSLGEINITLGFFINLNISLNIFLLWRGVQLR
jgi:hypothetical protein